MSERKRRRMTGRVCIKGTQFVRDLRSKAILNTDIEGLKAYQDRRKTMGEIKETTSDISELKKELKEIKELLKGLINGNS